MAVYRVSYKLINGGKCPDIHSNPDKLFSRILKGMKQMDAREIWEDNTEWLLHTEEYAGELWKLAETILSKFDEKVRERKCVLDKKECGQGDCKFLSLQLCVSEVHHYGFYPDTDADAKIIQWLEDRGVKVYRRTASGLISP
ncbi:MAG: hypothetical protein FWF98_05605 [Dehalococcoidia bacterium]|nr:hypothetical protein [Dehalococcoidia bacterium]